MKKRCIITEAILMVVILQAILMLLKKIADPLIPNPSFAQRMTTMAAMILLCGVVLLYAKLQKTKLSVFPAHFSKLYVISTGIAAVILMAVPSNDTGGYMAILLLIYGSIVTPIYEELIFRGFLWNRLNSVLAKEAYTYIGSVLLFTVWHLGYMMPQKADGNWFAVLTNLFFAPEMIQSIRAVFKNRANRFAAFQLGTAAAGVKPFFQNTLPYFAHAVAVRRFSAVRTAAHAVDHFRCNGRMVYFTPKPRRLFPQSAVVMNGGNARVTFFAVQPAAGNQFFHDFPPRFCKIIFVYFREYRTYPADSGSRSITLFSVFTAIERQTCVLPSFRASVIFVCRFDTVT